MVPVATFASGVILLTLGGAMTAHPGAPSDGPKLHGLREGRPTRGLGVWSVRIGGAGVALSGAFSVDGAFAYA